MLPTDKLLKISYGWGLMHVGYVRFILIKHATCFMTFVAEVREIFVLMIIQFHGTKVLGTFAPEERKFHGSECSMERKFLEPSLLRNESSTGAKVPRSECSMERKFHGSESSLYGLFAPGNESA